MDFRPGDWLCTCGAHNYASKSACFKCRLPREAATGSQQQPGGYSQQPPPQQHQYQSQPYNDYGGGLGAGLGGYGNVAAYGGQAEHTTEHEQYGQYGQATQGYGDYGSVPPAIPPRDGPFDNYRAGLAAGLSHANPFPGMPGFDASTLFPSTLPPGGSLPGNFRPGDWLCSCGNHNYAIRVACGKCGKGKAGSTGNNLPGNFRPGDWMCKCGNHNYQSRVVCGKCQESKDSAKQTVAPQMAPNFQVGDWMCICGAHNYQSKTVCYKCNLAKESAQAELPATAGFRPGDWVCDSCKNHNYASRIVCGRCKAPKASDEPHREAPAATRDRSRSPKR